MNLDLLDRTLRELRIQPVGKGYIDLICPPENIGAFIDRMEALQIPIEGFAWWCHVRGDHHPCGMGGPLNRYGEGWFSEIRMDDILRFDGYEALRRYLLEEYPNSPAYKPCYVPAFWLDL